ncbi:GHKL domain-containing protein [Butyricicoccus sp. AF24-19AC]|nr:GHKL domain-containing protein [Butyricicoccus sp. AF24-19AC]RHQ74169.1 GHKL domain-containing protein [Butyricicoccus sp. AF24-19AC]
MGVNMNFLMNLIQLGLDVGILALCCEAVFRQKSEIKAKDFFIFPILLVLCVVPRVDFSVGANMTASFRSEGFEILPADNIVGLLFLIFAVLLLSSIFFGSKSSGTVFCGTMAAFSIFLFVKCLCAVLFAVCGATDILLLLGSRIAALCLIVVLEFTPFFDLIHQLVQRSDFTVLIVSSNIALLLMTVLSILSFDVDRLLANLWIIIILILAVLLLDSILLFLHQRRMQEQKRIHMIEQYVPIVEELISQVRARQHEFNNRMMAIEAAVASADTLEEARKEVAGLTGSIGISLNDRELLSCDSKMIAGMLFGKIKQAEVANLHIELSLHGLFKKTVTPETEWIEAIGILLDNAIEASPKGSTIFLSSKKQGDFLELTVSNPAPPLSNTEFMALFGKGVTTKASRDGHGFGLYNILRMTERYHGKILTRNESILNENYVVFGILMP